MASLTPISQSQPLFDKTQFRLIYQSQPHYNTTQFKPFRKNSHTMVFPSPNSTGKSSSVGGSSAAAAMRAKKSTAVVVSATAVEAAAIAKKRYPGEAKGFVEEMRFVAMKLHTRDQSKEGEKEAEGPPLTKWEPTVEGYLRFLVDSKFVYDTLEEIVERAAFPECKGLDFV